MDWGRPTGPVGGTTRPPVPRGVVILGAAGALLVLLLVQQGQLRSDHFWLFVFVVPLLVLHELSHGWLANAYGDPTPRLSGRLNPGLRKHVDPIGTVVVPAFLILLGFSPFGWAKPMPLNTRLLSRQRKMLVGLAGVGLNLALAIATVVALYVLADVLPLAALRIAMLFGVVNVSIALFYVLPIPPLDGSAVVERYLPARHWPKYLTLQKYSVVILLALFMLGLGFWANLQDFFIGAWGELLP